jgi:hypothetical protein
MEIYLHDSYFYIEITPLGIAVAVALVLFLVLFLVLIAVVVRRFSD